MANSTRSKARARELGIPIPIDSVFFEKQDARLCAQHCINNAMQERVVDAVLLSEYARKIDEEERKVAYDDDLDSTISNNYDETGYFSLQVIQSALAPYELTLVPINENSAVAASAKEDPVNAKLFIFHEKDHWYCARRFAGKQWITINSQFDPCEINDRDLASLVTTNVTGRQVFLVSGFLKDCAADEVYSRVFKDSAGVTHFFTDSGQTVGSRSEEEAFQEAVSLSLGKSPQELLREKRAKFLADLEKKKESASEGGASASSSESGNGPSPKDGGGGM